MSDSEKVQNVRKFYRRPSMWWVAFVCLMGVILAIVPRWDDTGIMIVLFVADCTALMAAMGVWLAFGTGFLRFPAIFVSTKLLATFLTLIAGPRNSLAWILMMFLSVSIIGTVSVPLIATRVIRNGHLSVKSTGIQPFADAIQFRILHLFILTTVIAGLLALGRIVQPFLQISGNSSWVNVTKIGLSLGLCSLVTTWATLGRNTTRKSAVSIVILAAICVVNFWMAGDEIGWVWSLLAFVVWVLLTLLMWSLRWEGYRFVAKDSHYSEKDSPVTVNPREDEVSDPFA